MLGAEIEAGGKDGVGQGVVSLVQNVVGGTFFAIGKISGGVADTIDAMAKNDLTSHHLKPKAAASDGKHPEHAVDGIVQGTTFLGKTVIAGVAGLVGNPYRGAKTGGATGVAKGVASGVTGESNAVCVEFISWTNCNSTNSLMPTHVPGLVVAPFVGALGFIAKTADGMGATTKMLELGVIEARCRPAR